MDTPGDFAAIFANDAERVIVLLLSSLKVCILFQVPLMPFLPVLSILCNMVMLVSVADTGNVIAACIMAGIGKDVLIPFSPMQTE